VISPYLIHPSFTTRIYRPVNRKMKLTFVTDEDARTMAAKYLTKYRPQFIENATKRESNDSPASAPGGDAIAA
jgi:symplekin